MPRNRPATPTQTQTQTATALALTAVSTLFDSVVRFMPHGALEDINATLTRIADRETERLAEEAAARTAMITELAELRAAVTDVTARADDADRRADAAERRADDADRRADDADRRADALGSEATRLREALGVIAHTSAEALGASTTAPTPSEPAGMADGADAAGCDASAEPAAVPVATSLVSRQGPEKTAAYFRVRNQALDLMMEERMAASAGGGGRSPDKGDGAGAAAHPG
ncbi:hypothetical protein [Rubrimonas cliftonensis]|uniref:Uncharacterized protein n=1 Tax=Rubrimonas cliftonensis TaxID=89524 RepID=A0A1H4G9M2_9RHOB|nr:hypothetical protein [Rubrimonas cliftonensis]SEB05720.1 hypothetical protein SAMN05444370_1423 [Rubrimonas cliftonensis]